MPQPPRSITLYLAGESLSLKTDRDPALLQHVADSVTERVEDLRQHARGIPNAKVYLLVALQLADELASARDEADGLRDEVRDRTRRLLELVDHELALLPSRTAEPTA